MESEKEKLHLEPGVFSVDVKTLELVREQDPEIWTGNDEYDDDTRQAFIMGCEGWEGVDEFNINDYEEELDALNKELCEELMKLYIIELDMMDRDDEITITNIAGEKIENVYDNIKEHILWVDHKYYDYYKCVYSSKTKTPAITLLCQSPVEQMYLVLQDVNIKSL